MLPKPKLRLLGDFNGKPVWVSPELPVHSPTGRRIHELDQKDYVIVSAETADQLEQWKKSQQAPDVPKDLLKD